jgi:hypothetical protein
MFLESLVFVVRRFVEILVFVVWYVSKSMKVFRESGFHHTSFEQELW